MDEQADSDRSLIVQAMKYRDGTFYMGSMQTARLYHVLHMRYGDAGFADALAGASREQLDTLLGMCKDTIEYMRRNPRVVCPCCGQLTDPKNIG